ncbi:uncharacterized protein LOC127798065 [Diospyros lotus]|uniref:uncharacterized protein LOC127798065 n=1 Tax=Diospyros lotus TaxID=55363 RepID=UPI002259928D|nr:uncharacterized protein LOC127798065 [Diospyros lotus]
MAATAASDANDGPVLSLINKRLRALRKKYNRILQMEDSVAQGKPLNKEQEEVLRSKPSLSAAIDELEKLHQPLSAAVEDEISLAVQRHQSSTMNFHDDKTNSAEVDDKMIEDVLNVLYFGTMFDVKSQNDFTSIMLTRTHERGCCLTYDYVTDDESADLLGERDLDFISKLGGFLISRRVDSSLSHKNALQRCIEHAKLWLTNSEQPIDSDSNITYAALRAKLNKIMASDYFTTTPEMKATVEMAAAAGGNYTSFHVPVHSSVVPVSEPIERLDVQYEQKAEDTADVRGNEEIYNDQSSPVEEPHEGEFPMENPRKDQAQPEGDKPQQGPRDVESEEQQHYIPRRNYPNHRGGRGRFGGGRRGYPNGRGGRGSSWGGGGYQNGPNQYYDQSRNYNPRSYYYNNSRGRGGRGGGGGNNQHHYHNSGAEASHSPVRS